jgi:hypothetical protein
MLQSYQNIAIIQKHLRIILLFPAVKAKSSDFWSYLGYDILSGEDYPDRPAERNVQVLPGIRDERHCR